MRGRLVLEFWLPTGKHLLLELSYDFKTEREVLISDSLASELKISIEDPKKGLWRLSDDPTRRNLEKPEYWS